LFLFGGRSVQTLSSTQAGQGYPHEAFLWHEAEDFTAEMVPFVEDGLDAGEPVMVAVTPEHTTWLRDALGKRSAQVEFVDMYELGRNPARIIPAWQQFLDDHTDGMGPARGIGEPIWPGRRAAELLECQLHEALLNVAVEPGVPFWLVCPYDAQRLSPQVVEEAYRSHSVIVHAGGQRVSPHYAGSPHVHTLLSAELSEPALGAHPARFSSRDVSRLLTSVKLELYVAGQSLEDAAELSGVKQSLAVSSLQRGSASGLVRIWTQPDAVVCEVIDDTVVSDPLLGRRQPGTEDHALWLANQLCDLVQLRSTPTGTAVRVLRWL